MELNQFVICNPLYNTGVAYNSRKQDSDLRCIIHLGSQSVTPLNRKRCRYHGHTKYMWNLRHFKLQMTLEVVYQICKTKNVEVEGL